MSTCNGGWGWVVVLGCFYQHAFAGSAIYSLSVFYISWVEDFNTGRGITSWVLTMTMAVSMGSGPVVASLSSRFGHRPVIIAGALFSAVGFFASCFVTSVYALIALIGVVAGLGQGMQYLPSLALIPFYFHKKRSFAMSIAMCGSGVGTFLYPSLLIWLEEQYTWRGSMLILSGLILNVVICGALMRPPPPGQGEEMGKEEDSLGIGKETALQPQDLEDPMHETSRAVIETSCKNDTPVVFLEIESFDADCPMSRAQTKGLDAQMLRYLTGEESHPVSEILEPSIMNSPLLLCGGNKSACQCNHCLSQRRQIKQSSKDTDKNGHIPLQATVCKYSSHNGGPSVQFNTSHMGRPGIDCLRDNGILLSNSLQQLKLPCTLESSEKHKSSSVLELRNRSSNKRSPSHHFNSASIMRWTNSRSVGWSHVDILLSSSVLDLAKADRKRNGALRQRLVLSIEGEQTSPFSSRPFLNDLSSQAATSCPGDNPSATQLNGFAHSHLGEASASANRLETPSCCPSVSVHLKIYAGIMKNPFFATFSLVNFLNSLTYLMPVVYMVDRAVDNGVDKAEAALAFSMYGVGNLFGRVTVGLLADQGFNSLTLGAACLMGCGLSTCLSPLCGAEAILHGIYCFTFGTCSGGFVILTPLILVDVLGLSLVSRTYGLTLMFQALGYVADTPVAGWIYDATSSYTVSFILHGAVIVLSALLLALLKLALLRSRGLDAAAADDDNGADAFNNVAVDGGTAAIYRDDIHTNYAVCDDDASHALPGKDDGYHCNDCFPKEDRDSQVQDGSVCHKFDVSDLNAEAHLVVS